MNIGSLIVAATHQGFDNVTIIACGEGSLLKMSSSNRPGGFIGGGDILSAGGGSVVMEREQSYLDTLDSISDEDVRGLLSVGWLIDVSHERIRLFENRRAGGRRYAYEPATAKAQARRVA
jgi:hypothetical protein